MPGVLSDLLSHLGSKVGFRAEERVAESYAAKRGAESLAERLAPYEASRTGRALGTSAARGERGLGGRAVGVSRNGGLPFLRDAKPARMGSLMRGGGPDGSLSARLGGFDLEDRVRPVRRSRPLRARPLRAAGRETPIISSRVGEQGQLFDTAAMPRVNQPRRKPISVSPRTRSNLGGQGQLFSLNDIPTGRPELSLMQRIAAGKKAKYVAGGVVGLAGYGAYRNRHGRAVDPMGAGRPTGPFVY